MESKKQKTEKMEIDNPEEILFIKTTFSKADNKKEEHQSGSIKPR